MGRHAAKSWFALALSLVVALVLMAPAILSRHALTGDAPVHILWQSQFAPLVWRGHLYPHWLPDMNYGLGSPGFFFYPPLLQWTGSLFAAIAPGIEHASLRINLAIWLLSAMGGFGTWRWLRAIGLGSMPALLGALVYLLLPYRAYFDIYQRGALPELAGISVMPWLPYFAQRLKQGSRGGWGGYALATGAILYSHLPAAEMGILFASFYIIAITERAGLGRFWLRAGTSTVCGFLIGALAVAPALGLLHFIPNPANMWGERHQPQHWLLFSHEKWFDPGLLPITALLCLFTLVAVAFYGALALRGPAAPLRRIGWFLIATVLVVLFLNTAPSHAFWMLNTPLSRVQFPFRLLSLTLMALSGLAAIALHAAMERGPRWIGALLWATIVGLFLLDAGLFVLHGRLARFEPMTNAQIVGDTLDTPEYVLGSLPKVRALFDGDDPRLLHGAASAHLVDKGARHRAYAVDATAESLLAVPQFAFSGWRCRIDGGAWTPAATLAEPRRIVICGVPAGRHRLDVMLPPPLPEKAGIAAMLIGLLLAIASFAWSARHKHA